MQKVSYKILYKIKLKIFMNLPGKVIINTIPHLQNLYNMNNNSNFSISSNNSSMKTMISVNKMLRELSYKL